MNQDTPQFKKRQKDASHNPKQSRDVSGMKYKLQKRAGVNYLGAINGAGAQLANIVWDSKTGRVNAISTHPDFQGLGIATNLWDEAHRLADVRGDIIRPVHSEDRTNAGEGWARTVSGEKPPIAKSPGSRAMDMAEEIKKANG
jgi:ribosomal protein S18 acetylase RimI-like enzyme